MSVGALRLAALATALWASPVINARADDKPKELSAVDRIVLRATATARTLDAGKLHSQSKFVEATQAAREALAISRKLYPHSQFPKGHNDLASALSNLAYMLEAEGKSDEAGPHYRESLAMVRDQFPPEKFPNGHIDVATSLGNLAAWLDVQGKPAEAEPLLREALAIARKVYPAAKYPRGHRDLGLGINNLASILESQGKLSESEPLFREALAAFRKLHPPDKFPEGHLDLANSLNNMGNVLEAGGKLGEAEPYIRQCVEMRRKLIPVEQHPRGHPDLTRGIGDLGFLLYSQGRPDEATPYNVEALEMARKLYPIDKFPDGHPDLARCLNNLGNSYRNQGKSDEAEPLFRDALAMYRRLYPAAEAHPDLARSLGNLAAMLASRGKSDEAETFYRDALAMNRRVFPPAKYPRGHPDLATSISNFGAFLYAFGKPAEAGTLLRETLEMRRGFFPTEYHPDGHPDLVMSLHNMGRLLASQGNLEGAEPCYRDALAMCAALTAKLGESAEVDVALDFAASQPLVRDVYLSVTARGAKPPATQYPSIWQSRSGVSRVYEWRQAALSAELDSPGVRSVWDRLNDWKRVRERLLLAVAPKNDADRQQRDRELHAANEQVRTLERKLLDALPDLARSQRQAQSTPTDLQKALPADAAFIDLLHYTLFEHDPAKPHGARERQTHSYVAFVVTRDAIERIELGPAAPIDEAVVRWRQHIIGGKSGATMDGETLRRLVWQPIEAKLPKGIAAVYLAPDAGLTRVPFAALPGRNADKQPDRVLLDDYAIATVPHGPFLHDWLTRAAAPAGQTLLAVGGVRYDDRPTGADQVAQRSGPAGVAADRLWSFLKGTVAEAEQIRAIARKTGVPVTSLEGARADAAAVLAELPKATVAHFATHGYFADHSFRSVLQLDEKLYERGGLMGAGARIGSGAKNPLVLSGLVLAGANRPETPGRGILTGESLLGADLRKLDLAVLSACETGLGDVAGGEGVYGLARAFHVTGCKNVIASLWKVDDEPTAALMALFYRGLWEEKLPPIEALRQAQLAVYRDPARIAAWASGERGPNLKTTVAGTATVPTKSAAIANRASPRTWAGFVLSGVGR